MQTKHAIYSSLLALTLLTGCQSGDKHKETLPTDARQLSQQEVESLLFGKTHEAQFEWGTTTQYFYTEAQRVDIAKDVEEREEKAKEKVKELLIEDLTAKDELDKLPARLKELEEGDDKYIFGIDEIPDQREGGQMIVKGDWGKERVSFKMSVSDKGEACFIYKGTPTWASSTMLYCNTYFIKNNGQYQYRITQNTRAPERRGLVHPITIKDGDSLNLFQFADNRHNKQRKAEQEALFKPAE